MQLMPETLYLTCNIIDRYLSIRNVSRKRLQLVSTATVAGQHLQLLHKADRTQPDIADMDCLYLRLA